MDLSASNRFDRKDYIFLAGLFVFTVLYLAKFFNFSAYPFEDAAILMRYAEHLASGHGIVWNIGEAPIDGATDFLFMAVTAGVIKLGLSVESAVRLICLLSHFLTIFFVYYAVRGIYGCNRWLALLSSMYLAIGPALGHIQAYFGTPFFALFACLTWILAIKLVRGGSSHLRALLFGLTALITALIRPEGVFLTGLILIAVIYMKGFREARKEILYFIIIFAVLGGFYFWWRWNYFGYPLPNPFYKKGGGHVYIGSLRESILNIVRVAVPFILVYVAAFRSRETTRLAVFSMIPIAGFVFIWLLLSNEMNFFMRFQYPVLPILLISWPPLLGGLMNDWQLPDPAKLGGKNKIIITLVLALAFIGVLGYQYTKGYGRLVIMRDGRYDIARMLSEYKDKDYTIATTEAGLLPLYSRWRAIDTWGLNDSWIAHHGEITAGYLDTYKPEVIMFHAYHSPLAAATDDSRWGSMVGVLESYAYQRGYKLAAVFGRSPYDTHYYFIRPDFRDSDEISNRIHFTDYYWYESGEKCLNFAGFSVTNQP